MKSTATFFSWIFHPLLMVTYGSIIYLFFFPSDFQPSDDSIPFRILALIFISTFLLPLIFGFFLQRLGKISNLEMEKKQERNWPLLQTALIYIGGYYAVNSKAVPAFIQLFLLGSIIGILFSLLINLKWKISLHMIGVGGFCGGITALLITQQTGHPILVALGFLVAGILGSARLILNAHTPAQIFTGFLGGFAIEFSLIYFAFY